MDRIEALVESRLEMNDAINVNRSISIRPTTKATSIEMPRQTLLLVLICLKRKKILFIVNDVDIG